LFLHFCFGRLHLFIFGNVFSTFSTVNLRGKDSVVSLDHLADGLAEEVVSAPYDFK